VRFVHQPPYHPITDAAQDTAGHREFAGGGIQAVRAAVAQAIAVLENALNIGKDHS
jgi:hypothetical protein